MLGRSLITPGHLGARAGIGEQETGANLGEAVAQENHVRLMRGPLTKLSWNLGQRFGKRRANVNTSALATTGVQEHRARLTP
jgi:hypothetical protein